MKKTKIADSVSGIFLKNTRFKNNSIKISFILKPEKDEAAALALVPVMMATGSPEFPDFLALNRKLDSLYGADVLKSVAKIGDCYQYTLCVRAIGDRFSENGNLKAAAELLASLCFDRYLNGESYPSSDLEREKRIMCEKIASTLNEKRIYASDKAVQIMCKDEPYGYPIFGTQEQVRKITQESLKTAFDRLMKNAVINIQFCGAQCPDDLFDIFKEKFKKIDRSPETDLSQIKKSATKKSDVTEEMNISQSKLVIGLRANENETDKKQNAVYTVMNDIFGGGTYSKLFTYVREKLSLCYYCSASLNRKKGVIFVSSGVETENIEKAKDEILNQFAKIKNGEISDEEIENSKRTITGTLKTINDDLSAISGWYSARETDENPLSPEEFSKAVKSVTKEQIISAANEFSLDTVFILRPLKEN